MTWRLSEAGLLINHQSYGQTLRPLCDAFVRDRFWPDVLSCACVALQPLKEMSFDEHRLTGTGAYSHCLPEAVIAGVTPKLSFTPLVIPYSAFSGR